MKLLFESSQIFSVIYFDVLDKKLSFSVLAKIVPVTIVN